MHIHAYAKCVTRKRTHTHLDPENKRYTQYTEPGHTKIKCMVIYINYIYITDIQKARDQIFGKSLISLDCKLSWINKKIYPNAIWIVLHWMNFTENQKGGRNICKSYDKEILDYMQTMEYLAWAKVVQNNAHPESAEYIYT